MPKEQCPHCGDFLLSSRGPINTNILVVGDYPDWFDVLMGTPFCGGDKKVRAGNIIAGELERASINPARVRFTNLWLHGKKKKGECEPGFHATAFINELLRVEFALIAGTDPLQVLLGENISAAEFNGLPIPREVLPANVQAMAMVKASTGFDMLGEVRLAITRFGEMTHGK